MTERANIFKKKLQNHSAQNEEKTFFFQPKLSINQPNDVYEQEADAMADKVMRMSDSSFNNNNSFFKSPISSVQRKCQHCEEEQNKKMQRKESNNEKAIAGASADNYLSSLNGKGKSLTHDERNFFEPRFGYNFSDVRIHNDSAANESAKNIHALAYTTADNIVFNANQYQPGTESGRRLLAHELTHVVQQQSMQQNSIQMQQESFCPNGDVDDAAVQSYINNALRANSNDLNLAFSSLRVQRENHCCDLNLAAAEHYMWARLQVAEGLWSFFMIMGVIGYDFFKFIHLVPHTGDCPITRASFAQVRWASQGAADGEMDYYSNPH